MAYVNVSTQLPFTLDVQISVSKTQAELRRNFSVPCFVGLNMGMLPDASRIGFYSSMDAVASDFDSDTEAYKAATAFFSQSPRPSKLAIGEAFLTPQPARLVSGVITDADINTLKAITNGSFQVSYNIGGGNLTRVFSNLNFSLANSVQEIAAVIQAGAGNDLICTSITPPGGHRGLQIATIATGNSTSILFAAPTGNGIDVSTVLNLTDVSGGKVLKGYIPTDIAGELDNIAAAGNANGTYIYGWILEAGLRSVETQVIAAAWMLARTGIMPLTTNDLTAYDPAFTADLGSVIQATVNKRCPCLFHDDPNYYPDMSILTYLLSVDYTQEASTVTAKFKTLPGIPTVPLTETQWGALRKKGYNCFTLTGNTSLIFREGTTEDPSYYFDTVVNLDNFCEDLGVNVMNVFMRNKKVPYTYVGQLLLVDACQDTGNQYIYNGTFADRRVSDSRNKSGTNTIPAVDIVPAPISDATDAMREGRIGPPIAMTCQEAGAMHSLSIGVRIVS